MTVLSLPFLALMGCSGGPASPSETPAPDAVASDPAEPASPAEAVADDTKDSIEARLMAAGACADAGVSTPNAVSPQKLADGQDGLFVVCDRFAYQASFEYWAASPLAPLKTKAGATLGGLGEPMMAADGTVEWLEKARGPGDCGTLHTYVPSGDAWYLKTKRTRECDAATGDPAKPKTWPLVVTTGVLKELQNGDRGCYVVLEDDTNLIGEHDLCVPETEALVGKPVSLEMVTANTQSPDCEGDLECSLTIREQQVVRVSAR